MAVERIRVSNRDRKPLTAERLRQLLSYDLETGFFRRIAPSRPQASHYLTKPVGYVKPGTAGNGGGYLMVTVDGKAYRAHRLAWLYMTGDWPKGDVDHRDNDRTNNKWANLREATRSQNIHNMGMRERNSSGRKGATFDRSRNSWQAQITVNGAHHHLGRFETREEAGDAYDRAALKYFGDFARSA